jgi:translation initiation factor IF-3
MTNYRRKRGKPKEVAKQFFVNQRIPFLELKVIDEEGKLLGILSRDEAVEIAVNQEKDLIVINPKGEPPVAKIIEYSKFKYLLDKAEKSKSKGGDEVKTLVVSVRIATHDLNVQSRKADEFLKKGIKTRLQVRMERREKSHPEVAIETMQKFLAAVTVEYILESEPKLMGDSCIALLKQKK